MAQDAVLPHDTPLGDPSLAAATGPSWAQRFRQFRNRADVARIDGLQRLRDRAAISASTGRAQIERAQSFVSFQARRRPLAVTGLAVGAGVIIGFVLRARAQRSR